MNAQHKRAEAILSRLFYNCNPVRLSEAEVNQLVSILNIKHLCKLPANDIEFICSYYEESQS